MDPEETHHLVRVLRLKEGARIGVFDGRGMELEAEVLAFAGDQARLKIIRRLPARGESPLELALGVSLAKGEAMDAVVRLATELGVRRIIPFVSERSEKYPPSRIASRLEKWLRCAREALKSCGRSILPEIGGPWTWEAVLAQDAEIKLICWEDAEGGGLPGAPARPRPAGVLLLIGPEGGFSVKEVEQARDAGFTVISLGPRRLKVATAALAALTLLQHRWGDLA